MQISYLRGWGGNDTVNGLGEKMKIEKFDSEKKSGRVPLARGDSSSGETFIMSVLADGSGIVLEFADEEAYFLPIQELVKEFLSQRTEAKKEGLTLD